MSMIECLLKQQANNIYMPCTYYIIYMCIYYMHSICGMSHMGFDKKITGKYTAIVHVINLMIDVVMEEHG
jgi:hypothetical protein